jgi:hypothetical protein
VGGRLVGPVGGGKLVHRRQPALYARRRHVILGGNGAAAFVRRRDARITAQCWRALWRRCGRHASRQERYHLHSASAARESTSRRRCRHPSRYRAVAFGSSSHDAAAPWAPAIAVSAAGIPTRGSGWTRDGRHRVGHHASTASVGGARHHRCAFRALDLPPRAYVCARAPWQARPRRRPRRPPALSRSLARCLKAKQAPATPPMPSRTMSSRSPWLPPGRRRSEPSSARARRTPRQRP